MLRAGSVMPQASFYLVMLMTLMLMTLILEMT